MAIRAELRAIVMRAIDTIAPTVLERAGYDKTAWRQRVAAHMETQEPEARAELANAFLDDWYALRVDEYIRSSKDAAIENLRELDEIKRALRERNRIVQVLGEDGVYRAKRIIDCTAMEHDRLGEQYEKSSAADARRGRFHRLLARQMRLAGLSESDPLSTLLAA